MRVSPKPFPKPSIAIKLLVMQSLVIIEYIAETFSAKSLLPSDSAGRARVRSLAQYVVSEIQPLQNTRLDGYMAQQVRRFPCALQVEHWSLPGPQQALEARVLVNY
jgi:glutathione S-transferase